MNYKTLIAGMAAITILAGATALVLADRFNDDGTIKRTAQTSPPPSTTSTTQTSSLPNQQAANLDEAKKSLSFSPLQPAIQLNSETLSDIKVGTKSNMIDDSDTIYLTYSDSQGTLYKMSQSSKKHNYPTDTENVTLKIGGKSVVGAFYMLEEQSDGNGPNSSGSDVSSPTSYIFWSNQGVNYEISEFGRLTKAQLTQLANSLK